MLRRRHALAAVAIGMLLLSGCASDDVTPPSPTPSASAPVFASDEEAVEAAEAALNEYWRVSGEVFRAGGEGVEKLEPLVTAEKYADSLLAAEDFAARGWIQVGEIRVDSVEFQSSYADGETDFIVVSACVDYSGYSVQTAEGNKVELVEPRTRVPFEAAFQVTAIDTPPLVLARNEKWPEATC
jgi:outer membrane murein-binding lipoprotein Lpp